MGILHAAITVPAAPIPSGGSFPVTFTLADVPPDVPSLCVTGHILPCFTITAISSPHPGTAAVSEAGTVLRWQLPGGPAALTFTLRHNGDSAGTIPINDSMECMGCQGFTFDDPVVEVPLPG